MATVRIIKLIIDFLIIVQLLQVEHAAICCAKLTMGDWFVLMQIGDNIDVHIFTDLVKQIGMGLKKVYPSPDDQIMTAL